MTVTALPETPSDDAVRGKNTRLGLLLGSIVLLSIIGFMILFTLKGLPKDPEIVARMKQEESAQAADLPPVGEPEKAPIVTPQNQDQ
jgi:hypothetical protein